jgi:hypothetical protein
VERWLFAPFSAKETAFADLSKATGLGELL